MRISDWSSDVCSSDLTFRLHQALQEKLAATPSLGKVLNDIEMPLMPVLARIERQGALVDANLLGVQSVELGEKLVALEREAFAIAGEEFNLGSPKQQIGRASCRERVCQYV